MGPGRIERFWLDTSLILRLLTNDPPELAAKSLEVFRGAEEGRYILRVHPLVVAESFYTLRSFYQVPKQEVSQALRALLDRKGIEVWRKKQCIWPFKRPGRVD